MAPVIEVDALTKSYGAVTGIDEVSFTVSPGEVFGFLGPNGAGKTTTIRILMQLLRPDAGRTALFGVALSERHPELHERVGYLPGDFRPPPEVRSGYYLQHMARYRSRPPALRDLLCDRFGFGEKEQRQQIKHLSHGNRQKLGLVLALENVPELAILDEPTLGLDPLVQDAFYDVVSHLRDRGTTIFLSSHVLSEVEKVCSRVAIVRGGSLVAVESIDSLKRHRPRRLIVVLDAEDAAAHDLAGARLLTREGARCTYLIEGDVRAVVGALPTSAREFFLPESDLEDVFLAYYRGSAG
jgi:ABC-2 type transport system ATP-binding protein